MLVLLNPVRLTMVGTASPASCLDVNLGRVFLRLDGQATFASPFLCLSNGTRTKTLSWSSSRNLPVNLGTSGSSICARLGSSSRSAFPNSFFGRGVLFHFCD